MVATRHISSQLRLSILISLAVLVAPLLAATTIAQYSFQTNTSATTIDGISASDLTASGSVQLTINTRLVTAGWPSARDDGSRLDTRVSTTGGHTLSNVVLTVAVSGGSATQLDVAVNSRGASGAASDVIASVGISARTMTFTLPVQLDTAQNLYISLIAYGGSGTLSVSSITIAGDVGSVQCADPSTPVGGTRNDNGASLTAGASVTYACLSGLVLVGDATITCLDSGLWSAAAPMCAANVTCPNPTTADGVVIGSRDGSAFTPGSSLTLTCPDGFLLQGNATVTCGSDGQWSAPPPSCVTAIDGCTTPGAGTHTMLTIEQNVASYECCNGFTLSGSAQRTCTAGTWSGAIPTCTPVECGRPSADDPLLVNMTLTGTAFAARASYACIDPSAYVLVGEPVATCGAAGLWSSLPAMCVRMCSDLNAPLNGEVSFTAGNRTGSIAHYTCNAGYVLYGPANRMCAVDGTWQGSSVACRAPGDVDTGSTTGDVINTAKVGAVVSSATMLETAISCVVVGASLASLLTGL